jgi:phosphoserine phosphatase
MVSNQDKFDEAGVLGALKGIDITIADGQGKLEAVERRLAVSRISLGECVVIGDGLPDIPLLRGAGLSIASPLACDEVRAVAQIHLF